MPDLVPIRRALISVSDKAGVVELARALAARGVEILSTGGTAKLLAAQGVPVTPVEAVTGVGEMLDGRVKTLHPAVHGGILARRDLLEHARALERHKIGPIDLVCVNLYPFEETIASKSVTHEETIEQIDIGGPAMIRSAAKNHEWVAVLVEPGQYAGLVQELDSQGGSTTLALRSRLAAEAFARTAAYDAVISGHMASKAGERWPRRVVLPLSRVQELRYGENPHQAAALYALDDPARGGNNLARARLLHGKAMSYNNVADAAAALGLARRLIRTDALSAGACVIKHANPCGAAVASSCRAAVEMALAGDPLAAYGGILGVNVPLDESAAERLCGKDIFLEVIVAPGFAPAAAQRLMAKSANVRLLEVGPLTPPAPGGVEYKMAGQAVLAQEPDLAMTPPSSYEHRAGPAPSPDDLRACGVLEIITSALLSNAVAIGGDEPGGFSGVRLFGAGAGQVDRVTACRIAAEKAGDLAKGAIAFSDAFFPFSDGPQRLIDAGVRMIVHPGGSKRDDDTFRLCHERGVTCVTTGVRHFRH